jgi:predicted nucleotidyltransferase
MNMAENSTFDDLYGGVPNVHDPEFLGQVVKRIVEAVHPLRVILFGSAARGDGGLHSDLDFLIVMPDGIHRRQTARCIFRRLSGMGFAKDVVVVTEEDVRRFKDNPSLIVMPALQEGKELYRAAG